MPVPPWEIHRHIGLEQLPQNEKRLRLVERALESDAVSRHEL